MHIVKRIAGVVLAAVIIAVLKAAFSTPASSLAAGTDWSAAVAQSKAERKPILLVFGGPW